MPRFKEGDRVICIENPEAYQKIKRINGLSIRGSGWKRGKIFIINELIKYTDETSVYFPRTGDGVYEPFLAILSPELQLKEGHISAREYTTLKEKEYNAKVQRRR